MSVIYDLRFTIYARHGFSLAPGFSQSPTSPSHCKTDSTVLSERRETVETVSNFATVNTRLKPGANERRCA